LNQWRITSKTPVVVFWFILASHQWWLVIIAKTLREISGYVDDGQNTRLAALGLTELVIF
jgi:hypothetical protein